ncbi:MAG: hypothetical protein LLG09_09405 [Negativicutes bacterium]|nr:hypothetical protein [Negativicutes bacterium]
MAKRKKKDAAKNSKQSSAATEKNKQIRDENGKIGWTEVPGEILLDWKGRPWRARPKKLAILVFFYLCLCLLAVRIIPEFGIFLAVVPLVLLGNSSSHLVNSYYVVTTEGVYWKNFANQMFKPWIAIEGFIFEDEMAELFFERGNIRARIQRSMPVYYDQNREEVERLIREYHGAAWKQIRARMESEDTRIREEVVAKLEGESQEKAGEKSDQKGVKTNE